VSCGGVAEVTKAVQARKEEKQRKAQQQLLESRQSKARGAAAEDDDEEEEAALDASLDQVGVGYMDYTLPLQSNCFSDAHPAHALAMIDPCGFSCFLRSS
jgi:hypothetical protein